MDVITFANQWGNLIGQLIALIGFLFWIKFEIAWLKEELKRIRKDLEKHEGEDYEFHDKLEKKLFNISTNHSELKTLVTKVATIVETIPDQIKDLREEIRGK